MTGNRDEYELRFDQVGVTGITMPQTFSDDDWDLPVRVVKAVRDALDPPTVVLPIKPVLGVEDTQPISTWFQKP